MNLLTRVLVSFLAASSLLAQSQDIKFRHLTSEDGLSHNTVFSIFQDSKGFMWFGTQAGLNLYDGHTFRVFKSVPGDTQSLSSNRVMSIYEDRAGTLWICTYDGGLNQLDRRTMTFKAFKQNPNDPHSISSNFVHSVYEDKSGVLWVALPGMGGGLSKLDRATGQFKTYKPDDTNPDNYDNHFTVISEDRTGVLWIATANGLKRFDPITETFHTYGNWQVRCVYEDKLGTLWFGTPNGLRVFDRTTETVKTYKPNPADSSGSWSNFVEAIHEDRFGTLWISTYKAIYHFDRKTEKFKTFRQHPIRPERIGSAPAQALYEDKAGVIWIGTTTGALTLWDRRLEKFRAVYQGAYSTLDSAKDHPTWRSSAVSSIYEDSDGSLWIGTTSGLSRWGRDKNSGIVQRLKTENDYNLNKMLVYSIHEDKNGTLWLGTGGGLKKLNRQTGKLESSDIGGHWAMALCEDRQGYIWIGTQELIQFDPIAGKAIATYDVDPTQPDVGIISILEDRSGVMWMGVYPGGGLNRFDPSTKKFKIYKHDPHNASSLSNNNINTIYEDKSGVLWIGTAGGLNKFDRTTEKFTRYREVDGLPDNVVQGILEDDHGNLWLSTYNGISKFTPPTNSTPAIFRNYDVSDGLQSKEFMIFSSYFKSKDGRMFFGGVKGFNEFHPDSIRDEPYIPPVFITGLRLFNKPVPLPWGLAEPTSLVFNYDENVFSLEFAALSYSASEKNEYSYKLEGFDRDWINNGTKHEATYTNLDHGEYVFRVKGSNHDGVWNEEGTSLKITITPPPWKTWWAYSLYGLAILASLYGVRRFELNRKLKNAQIKESRLRAQAAESQAQAAEAQAKAAEAQSKLIQIENDRRAAELEEARQLQLSMLPKDIPKLDHLDIAVSMKTATEVGGDYYDFHLSADGTLTIVLGDATGHGLKAGHMVSTVKGLFNAYAASNGVARTLSEMSRCIKDMHLSRLSMCLMMARIQPPPTPSLVRRGTGGGSQGEGAGVRLHLSSAAMPPALIYRHAEKRVDEILIKALPLGAMRNVEYQERELELHTGDTTLFMSDGFPELANDTGETLGYERAMEIFEKACLTSPPPLSLSTTPSIPLLAKEGGRGEVGRAHALLDRLHLAANNWSNGSALTDDVTFVVVRVKEEPSPTLERPPV